MKKFLFLFLAFPALTFASNGDTTIIRFHNKTDMNGNGAYDYRGKFPDGSKTYRQILMKYTLGCSSSGCSGWDYTTKIQYLKPLGIFDSSVSKIDTSGGKHDTSWNKTERIEPFELGRVITPYGTYMRAGTNGYNNEWLHQHWFDITDYVSFLKDSATIRAFYDGWTSGFSVTLDFYFIEGTPPRNILSINNLWGRGGDGYGYSVSDTFEKYVLYPKSVSILPNAKSASFQFTPSGHGFDNDQYAAEFYEENADVLWNRSKIGSMHIWRDDCGKNPISPQGGTWIYNRANWCPGSTVNTFGFDINNTQLHPGGNDTVDVNFAPFNWKGNQGPSYIISSVFVQYGDNNFNDDVSMKDIIAPSTNENYGHENPVCYGPIIEIKNNGKNTLTSCIIKYGLSTGVKTIYNWSGNLLFNHSQRISLPSFNWAGAIAGSAFEVDLSSPNGKSDEWSFDNKMKSNIKVTPVHETDIIIWLKTNNRPGENNYQILDWNDNIVFERKNFSQKNYVYKDTVHLAVGCYKLILSDTGGDGLSWWADTAQGNGYIRFRNYKNQSTKIFEPDFGSELLYNFTTAYSVGIKDIISNSDDVLVYPNPATKVIHVQFDNLQGNAVIHLFDITGRDVFKRETKESLTTIPIENLPKGIYVIEIINDGIVHTEKIVIE